MATSNTKSKLFNLFLTLVLASCNSSQKLNDCLPLYHFNENILLIGYNSSELQAAKVVFSKHQENINGSFSFTQLSDTSAYGQVQFDSIHDTICKTDTIMITIASEEYLLTEIVQRWAKKPHGNRPAFVEFKLDGTSLREGQGVIRKH